MNVAGVLATRQRWALGTFGATNGEAKATSELAVALSDLGLGMTPEAARKLVEELKSKNGEA